MQPNIANPLRLYIEDLAMDVRTVAYSGDERSEDVSPYVNRITEIIRTLQEIHRDLDTERLRRYTNELRREATKRVSNTLENIKARGFPEDLIDIKLKDTMVCIVKKLEGILK